MSVLNIQFAIGNLPEGWLGKPQDLLDFIAENLTAQVEGGFLTGQVGGAEPASDIGLWVDGTKIKVFGDGSYREIDTVPIGGMILWPTDAALPTDYLLAENGLYIKADYPDLAELYGSTWNKSTDDASTHFRVPDLRGRAPVGAGIGDYNPKSEPTSQQLLTGKTTERDAGTYYGLEWGVYKQPTQPNAPTPRYRLSLITPGNAPDNGTVYTGVSQPSAVVKFIIRAK